jgi:hypothetical protein
MKKSMKKLFVNQNHATHHVLQLNACQSNAVFNHATHLVLQNNAKLD